MNPRLSGRFLARLVPVLLLLAFGVAETALAEDATADPDRGRKLYRLCIKCHGENGAGNREALAPAIAGMPVWYVEAQLKNFKNGVRGLHHQDTGGLRMYPMSQWLANEADQKAVAAWVAKMAPVDPEPVLEAKGDATRGQGYYAVCSACHGANGDGNQGMGAPPLAGQNDWYLFSSIKKYKDSIRGTGKGDALGAAMIGMVATLPNDQAIRDVIAHIQSLQPVAKAQ